LINTNILIDTDYRFLSRRIMRNSFW